MKEEHNHAQVGYAMIVVAGSLAAIGILAIFLADDVLFSDNMQRDMVAHFEGCKEIDFKSEDCEKYWDRINTKISGIYVDDLGN